jgi:hypothetical protein
VDELPDWMRASYLDSNYRTVVTEQDVLLYRVFGGNAEAGGAFVSTRPVLDRISAKVDLALLPEWKNTRMYEAVIRVPKGTTLNIGKVAPQTLDATGTVLRGRADQVLMPENWPLEWIQRIRVIDP